MSRFIRYIILVSLIINILGLIKFLYILIVKQSTIHPRTNPIDYAVYKILIFIKFREKSDKKIILFLYIFNNILIGLTNYSIRKIIIGIYLYKELKTSIILRRLDKNRWFETIKDIYTSNILYKSMASGGLIEVWDLKVKAEWR